MRRAKIVCTLGPSSGTREQIDALVAAGMDCARLNFSHGDHASHARLARLVREASAHAQRPLAILADLCGPKMRTGRFADGSVQLRPGDEFVLTTADVMGDATRVSVTYKKLSHDARPGDIILLDDGLLRLKVARTSGSDVICIVEIGGTLSDNKGINLPGAKLSTPALTEKDKRDLAFAVEVLAADFIALSFVRNPEDVLEAKDLAGSIPIIAKIEKPEAIDNLDAILEVTDGVMVARGDLGVEMGAEKVPLIQKRIIRAMNARGGLVITATQMLDSMIRNPRPTRAEAADVANAIIDGTDAVMLSGETASGAYPVKSVEMMNAIIREVEEAWLDSSGAEVREGSLIGEWDEANAAARAAALLSRMLPIKAVVVLTHDGRSARLLSEYRPRAPIIAITSDTVAAQRLALEWGVVPLVEVPAEDMEESLRIATSTLVRKKLCSAGDQFALVAGWPASGPANMVKLHRL